MPLQGKIINLYRAQQRLCSEHMDMEIEIGNRVSVAVGFENKKL